MPDAAAAPRESAPQPAGDHGVISRESRVSFLPRPGPRRLAGPRPGEPGRCRAQRALRGWRLARPRHAGPHVPRDGAQAGPYPAPGEQVGGNGQVPRTRRPVGLLAEVLAPGFRTSAPSEFRLARGIGCGRAVVAGIASAVLHVLVDAPVATVMADRQFLFRPTWKHYATSAKDIYICSSSTPPGGGVHGMCGYHAAKMALSRLKLS